MDKSAKDLVQKELEDGTYVTFEAGSQALEDFEIEQAHAVSDYEHVMLPDYSGTYPVLKKEVY